MTRQTVLPTRRAASLQPTRVLAHGDLAYPAGSRADLLGFVRAWHAVLPVLRAVPGNHEYLQPGARAYFTALGSRGGDNGHAWRAWNEGSWRVIALDGNCANVGCGRASTQVRWLANELRATRNARPDACILAFWYQTRFSSGPHGDTPDVAPLWVLLARARADVVLNGHDHDHERFTRMSAAGTPDAHGMREFVVGTGGSALYRTSDSVHATSQRRVHSARGVLKLTLHPRSYEWQFVSVGARVLDHGTSSCS